MEENPRVARTASKRGAAGSGKRLSAADWERAALRAIARGGVASLGVEPLAAELGVTKGSFYWHFKSREALLAAALLRWERDATEDVIALLAPLTNPRERLRTLIETASARSSSLHIALSAAADHPAVGPVLERVSARRIGYLAASFRELGLAPAAAHDRAVLTYAAYVGSLHLAREGRGVLPRGRSLSRYLRHLTETLIP